MCQTRIILILIAIIYLPAIAQPPIEWMRNYDDGEHEMLADIYKVSNEGYIACGTSREFFNGGNPSTQMLLTRIDNGGDVIWQNTFGADSVYEDIWNIIETVDGNLIWIRSYEQGYSHAIIELKSGEYVTAARSNREGYLLCIEGNRWRNSCSSFCQQ